MIETIFFTLIISLFLTIIGYVIYSITSNKSLKDNNQVDEVLKDCDSKLSRLINPKLQQVIEEAKTERKLIEENLKKERDILIQKEKERLFENDMIYNMIKESILNGKDCIEIECSNYHITAGAIRLIPELRLAPMIIGNGFNYDDLKSIRVYF